MAMERQEMEQQDMEQQMLTDPDVQRDYVFERGEDGELHEVEVLGDAADA